MKEYFIYIKDNNINVTPLGDEDEVALAKRLNLSNRKWECRRNNGNHRYICIIDYDDEDYIEVFFTSSPWDYPGYKIYDLKLNKLIEHSRFSWSKRYLVSSKEDAMELLSIKITRDFGDLSKNKLDEINEFADKWNIPFSLDLMMNISNIFNSTNPYWESSSSRC